MEKRPAHSKASWYQLKWWCLTIKQLLKVNNTTPTHSPSLRTLNKKLSEMLVWASRRLRAQMDLRQRPMLALTTSPRCSSCLTMWPTLPSRTKSAIWVWLSQCPNKFTQCTTKEFSVLMRRIQMINSRSTIIALQSAVSQVQAQCISVPDHLRCKSNQTWAI